MKVKHIVKNLRSIHHPFLTLGERTGAIGLKSEGGGKKYHSPRGLLKKHEVLFEEIAFQGNFAEHDQKLLT